MAAVALSLSRWTYGETASAARIPSPTKILYTRWNARGLLLGARCKRQPTRGPVFLRTSAVVAPAIEPLERLQCLNTIEVVIPWAWTTVVVNTVDQSYQKLIRPTKFYQIHGTGHLAALRRRIAGTNGTIEIKHVMFLALPMGPGMARAILYELVFTGFIFV